MTQCLAHSRRSMFVECLGLGTREVLRAQSGRGLSSQLWGLQGRRGWAVRKGKQLV